MKQIFQITYLVSVANSAVESLLSPFRAMRSFIRSIIEKFTIPFLINSLIVAAVSSTLVWSYILFDNKQIEGKEELRNTHLVAQAMPLLRALEEAFDSALETADPTANLDEDFEKIEQFFTAVELACISSKDISWKWENFAEESELRGGESESSEKLLCRFSKSGQIIEEPECKYQIDFQNLMCPDNAGTVPEFQIIQHSNYPALFIESTVNKILGNITRNFWLPVSVCSLVLIFLIYSVLRQLVRLEQEVRDLWSDDSVQLSEIIHEIPINESGYTRDLSRFIKLLQSYVLQIREIRREIFRGAFELSKQLGHERNNLLQKVYDSGSPGSSQQNIVDSKIRFVVEHTDHFINRMLELNRDEIPVKEEKTEICDLFQVILFLFEKDNSDIEFQSEGLEHEMWASLPSDILQSILFELMTNAAKYSHQSVFIRVWKSAGKIQMEFHNDGHRFPEDEKESMKLLEWGERGPTDTFGTGLGLYFVKKGLDAWGGSLKLRNSRKLGGACVCLEMPDIG